MLKKGKGKRRRVKRRLMRGMSVRKSPSGFCVIELDFTADPKKRDPKWIRRVIQNSKMSENDIQREYFRNWKVPAGTMLPFYPEFKRNGGRRFYVHNLKSLISTKTARGPIPVVHRGWDFGKRGACVWAQHSPRSNRIWVLHEMMPDDMDTYQLADVVKYLSNQIDEQELMKSDDAYAFVQQLKETGEFPDPPWFDKGIAFVDWSGHEADKRTATVESAKAPSTDAGVLETKGIILESNYAHRSSFDTKMRGLLRRYADGWPGVVFSRHCPALIAGFEAGLHFAKPTEAKPFPDKRKPFADGYYEHLHDALGYVVYNTVPLEPEKEAMPVDFYEGRLRRTIMSGRAGDDEQLDLYEVRGGSSRRPW